MFKNIVNSAKDLANNATASVVQGASDNLDSGKSKINDFVDQNWPKIEAILIEQLTSMAAGKINNMILEKLLDHAYDALPFPIRLVLSREKIVEIAMSNSDSLLRKIQDRNQAIAV